VSCPRTQQANLPVHFHTNPFKCWTSSRKAVNTNFESLLVWLGQGIEPYTDYVANALTTRPRAGRCVDVLRTILLNTQKPNIWCWNHLSMLEFFSQSISVRKLTSVQRNVMRVADKCSVAGIREALYIGKRWAIDCMIYYFAFILLIFSFVLFNSCDEGQKVRNYMYQFNLQITPFIMHVFFPRHNSFVMMQHKITNQSIFAGLAMS